MNILFLSRRFNPDIGGVEKHVYEISKIFIKNGHQVTVITESKGKTSEIKGIKIVRIPNISEDWFKKFKIWIWFFKNIGYLKSSDVVHAHDVFYWYLPFRFIFLSKKCFITFHGYESYPISNKSIFLRKVWEKLSSGNIIVGDFIKKWYHTKPNYVIYGGVIALNKITSPKNEKSALFYGRLDYHTGILDYVKVIEIVRKKIPDFEFTIVGEGEELMKLKKYNPITFKSDVNKYLAESNFAFLSRYLSILEALIHKRLIFAFYDNPIKKDYLKMSPFAKFIITENSAEKMAQKVVYYLENPKEANKLTENGYRWAKTMTWENVAKVYLKLWNEK